MSQTNGVMMQYFHWYSPDDGNLWNTVKEQAKHLADVGITAVWLPPAYKGMGGKSDVGYGVYDLFDLGEFDQKGSVRTKYGTRQEYLDAIESLHTSGIQVYADAVLNHKMGGDAPEITKAIPFPQFDRLRPKAGLHTIKSYTHFYFPGRQGQYSTFEWHWWHFDAVDYNDYTPSDRDTVYLLEGKIFDDYVALERGNFSYLMGCDLDFQSESVCGEITYWGKWYLDTTHVDGFRLDATKHISAWFFPRWIDELKHHAGQDLFIVGEYWYNDIEVLKHYLDLIDWHMSLFDVPLHYHFHEASKLGCDYNMQHILEGTLVQQRPTHAVTFVENHDSQPLQALESVVEPWFKPLAYALILLRREGYPCIFHADYYGAHYHDRGYEIWMNSHQWIIDQFLYARHHYGYGDQYDYFDHGNVIGWTRLGDADHPKAMAVIMSNGSEGYKWMEVGRPNATFRDITEHRPETIQTNEAGWGQFHCNASSVSVWIEV